MCKRCRAFFCADCFFDRKVTSSHDSEEDIAELNTLVRNGRNRLESTIGQLESKIEKARVKADPAAHRRQLRRLYL